MNVAVETSEGVYTIDAETHRVLDFVPGAELPRAVQPAVELPLLVAAAAGGSTIVAILDRRPPLVISHDAGRTWREAGGGLPRGRAVAVAEAHPDLLLYGGAGRVYVSRDGGRFWHVLEPELGPVEALAWLE